MTKVSAIHVYASLGPDRRELLSCVFPLASDFYADGALSDEVAVECLQEALADFSHRDAIDYVEMVYIDDRAIPVLADTFSLYLPKGMAARRILHLNLGFKVYRFQLSPTPCPKVVVRRPKLQAA